MLSHVSSSYYSIENRSAMLRMGMGFLINPDGGLYLVLHKLHQVPLETIFDALPGDLFVLRNAGNLVLPSGFPQCGCCIILHWIFYSILFFLGERQPSWGILNSESLWLGLSGNPSARFQSPASLLAASC